MDIVLVVVVLMALLGGYFLFFKKGGAPEVSAKAPPQRLPNCREPERKVDRSPPAPAARDAAAPVVADAAAPAAPAEPKRIESLRPSVAPPPPSELDSIRRGLSRSRGDEGFFGRLKALFGGKREISPEIAAEIEEILLASDVGVETTKVMLTRVREQLERGELADSDKVWQTLAAEARRVLDVGGRRGSIDLSERPTVVLLVGVNGAGKTTTIGKLASKLRNHNVRCVLAAGDTFRAAAVQQLVVWGDRVGCEVIRGK